MRFVVPEKIRAFIRSLKWESISKDLFTLLLTTKSRVFKVRDHILFVSSQNPNDIAYVFSGYAPLTVRLAQFLARPQGWRGLEEVILLLLADLLKFSSCFKPLNFRILGGLLLYQKKYRDIASFRHYFPVHAWRLCMMLLLLLKFLKSC